VELQDFDLKRGGDPVTEERFVLAELLEKVGRAVVRTVSGSPQQAGDHGAAS
jgi:hypothetical protein